MMPPNRISLSRVGVLVFVFTAIVFIFVYNEEYLSFEQGNNNIRFSAATTYSSSSVSEDDTISESTVYLPASEDKSKNNQTRDDQVDEIISTNVNNEVQQKNVTGSPTQHPTIHQNVSSSTTINENNKNVVDVANNSAMIETRAPTTKSPVTTFAPVTAKPTREPLPLILDYERFIPKQTEQTSKWASSEHKPTFEETNGWDYVLPDDCPAKDNKLWKICDPKPCAFNSSAEPYVELDYPEYPSASLGLSANLSTLELMHRVLKRAWGSKHPRIDLYVRTGCGARKWLRYMLQSVYLFWPRFLGKITVVLDAFDANVVPYIVPEGMRRTHSIKIVYEHCPCMKGRVFNQYSYLNLYRYAEDSDYVVTIDADCAFHSPVTPDKLFDDKGRIILPTSLRFQRQHPWDQLQAYFTNVSHAPLGHAMVTQPVNFHVKSTFRPYLDWVKQIKGVCYESMIVSFLQDFPNPYFFCWMCQLKSFVVANNLTDLYDVRQLDVPYVTPYVRYATHVKWERMQVEPDQDYYDVTVKTQTLEGLCRYMGEIIFPNKCRKYRDAPGYIGSVTFHYNFQPLHLGTPYDWLEDALKQHQMRFSRVLRAVLEEDIHQP